MTPPPPEFFHKLRALDRIEDAAANLHKLAECLRDGADLDLNAVVVSAIQLVRTNTPLRHEYLRIEGHFGTEKFVLKSERLNDPNRAIEGIHRNPPKERILSPFHPGNLSFRDRMSQLYTWTKGAMKPDFARSAAHDRIIVDGHLPSGHEILEEYRPDGLNLFRLILVLNCIHEESDVYSPWTTQCYWFAEIAYAVLRTRFPPLIPAGEDASPVWDEIIRLGGPGSRAGTFAGIYFADVRREKVDKLVAGLDDEWNTWLRSVSVALLWMSTPSDSHCSLRGCTLIPGGHGGHG